MTKQNKQKGQNNTDQNNHPNGRNEYYLLGSRALLLLLFIWGLCLAFIPGEKERVSLYLQIAFNALIFLAMIYHARIYTKQWQAMQAQLERTDRPWLNVKIGFRSHLTFNDGGGHAVEHMVGRDQNRARFTVRRRPKTVGASFVSKLIEQRVRQSGVVCN